MYLTNYVSNYMDLTHTLFFIFLYKMLIINYLLLCFLLTQI